MSQQSTTRSPNRLTATIALGQSVSTPIPLSDMGLVALVLPAAWTAAALTFETSVDGGATWTQVFDDANAEVTIAGATMTARVTDCIVPTAAILAKLEGLHTVRLVSGVAGAQVAQVAERVFTVILKS